MNDVETIVKLYMSPEIQSKALRFKNQVEDFFKLNANLQNPQLPAIHTVKSRIKTEKSFRDKIERKINEGKILTATNFTNEITDLVGIRVLHLSIRQFALIHREILGQISNGEWEFYEAPKAYSWDDEAIEIYNGLQIQTIKKDQYTSVHYVIRIKNNDLNPIYCEIQVRTLFEEVWGEIDHTINYPYKTKSVACKEQLKSLSKIVMTTGNMVNSIFASYEEYNDNFNSSAKNIIGGKENSTISYSKYALADKYFPLTDESDIITKIINNLKIQNWYTSQNPAIDLLSTINLNEFEENQVYADKLFVLGRNIYQAACGYAAKAIDYVKNLEGIFVRLSDFTTQHLYSGMLYEVYFNSSNQLRDRFKTMYLDELYKLEQNSKLMASLIFIRSSMEKKSILMLPNTIPEKAKISIQIEKIMTNDIFGDKRLNEIKSLKINDKELISDSSIFEDLVSRLNTKQFIEILSSLYAIPKYKLSLVASH